MMRVGVGAWGMGHGIRLRVRVRAYTPYLEVNAHEEHDDRGVHVHLQRGGALEA